MEIKHIPGHKHYTTNEDGTVITRVIGSRKPNGAPLKQSFHKVKGTTDPKNGYMHVTLLTKEFIAQNGEEFTTSCYEPTSVHRIVAKTFLPPPPTPEHKWVNHEDGNKLNNHYTNLKWTTISENIQHAFDSGLKVMPKGQDHWMFGTKASDETKKLMSEKKLGENHPKFKGHYIVNGVTYGSACQAAKANNTDNRTVHRRALSDKFPEYEFVPKGDMK